MSQRSGLFGPAPEAGTAFMELYGTFWRHGQLDQQLKEAVRLRNARLTDCGYWKNVRFSLAREAGLTEDRASRIDDDFDSAELPERWKTALALTDHLILSPGPIPEPLAGALHSTFSAEELTELMLGVALFHGFSKMLIALGLEPAEMDTTVVPTPTPSGGNVDAGEPDPHTALLSARPDLASRWAHMAATLVAVAPAHAPTIDAVRVRLAQLMDVGWATEPNSDRAATPRDEVDPTATEVAELFAIDVRAITPEHRNRLASTMGDAGLIQLIMALAVYDGIYRMAAAVSDGSAS